MLHLALSSQNSHVSERDHSKFHSNLQKESPGKIHVVLSLIIPGIFSFAMYSVTWSMVAFIQKLYDASSVFTPVVLLMFFNRITM